tara:strand:+ start:1585 stop:1860 length:276 start_codon:yes stop_codon:yes gene_type:complete
MPKQLKKEIDLTLLKKLYEEGATLTELSKKFKVSYTAIRNRVKKAGCELRKQGIAEIELPKDLGEGSLRELAKKYGVSYQTIANRKKKDNG